MRTALALLLLSFAAPALADTVTLPCVRDNTLYENATGAVSNALGQTFFAGRTAQATNFRRRALVRFDVAGGVPAGATITAVTLSLHMSQAGAPAAQPVELHPVLADWGEGTSDGGAAGGAGAPSTAGDATWLHRFFNGTLWAAAGGDFAAAASASQPVGVEGPYAWSSAGLVADAQAWLDTPASNFGWLLLGNEGAVQSVKRFDSRENADPLARPALTIEYTPPGTPALSSSWGWIRAAYR
jgi:hypothetical protein